MKYVIYFHTRDRAAIKQIEQRFDIPSWRSVNGEVAADIKESDIPVLQEAERRGYIQIRHKGEIHDPYSNPI